MAKERWITVNGNHILIKEGQSVGDAIKERFGEGKKGKKRINGGKYEYSMDEGNTWEDMDGDSYNEMEADSEEFDGESDEDYKIDNSSEEPDEINPRPNEAKLWDTSLSKDEIRNMAAKYIGNDKMQKIAEKLDLDSIDDIDAYELVKSMSDDEIADMMRINGIEDEEDEEDDLSDVENGTFVAYGHAGLEEIRDAKRRNYYIEYSKEDAAGDPRYTITVDKTRNYDGSPKSVNKEDSTKSTSDSDEIVDWYDEEDFLEDGLSDEDRSEVENELGRKLDDGEWAEIRDNVNKKGKEKAINKIANNSEPRPELGTPDNWPNMSVEERKKWLNDKYNKQKEMPKGAKESFKSRKLNEITMDDFDTSDDYFEWIKTLSNEELDEHLFGRDKKRKGKK